jgi:hypothetical protein
VSVASTRAPDPQTKKPNSEKIKAFADANPEVLLQGKCFASQPVPASFGAVNYWACMPSASSTPAGPDWPCPRWPHGHRPPRRRDSRGRPAYSASANHPPEIDMRVAASLIAVIALASSGLAQAQSVDKNAPAQAASGKAATATKTTASKPAAAATGTRVTSETGKAKIEGVSTMRSTPADGKKGSGCGHAMAEDA